MTAGLRQRITPGDGQSSQAVASALLHLRAGHTEHGTVGLVLLVPAGHGVHSACRSSTATRPPWHATQAGCSPTPRAVVTQYVVGGVLAACNQRVGHSNVSCDRTTQQAYWRRFGRSLSDTEGTWRFGSRVPQTRTRQRHSPTTELPALPPLCSTHFQRPVATARRGCQQGRRHQHTLR